MDNTAVRLALRVGTIAAISAYSTLAHGQTAAPVQESDVPERPASLNGLAAEQTGLRRTCSA